jgi:hypothetical protein
MTSYPKLQLPNGKWQCCAEVWKHRQWRPSRCQRVAVENDSWCAQHSPVAAVLRKEKSDAAYNEKYNRHLPEVFGHRFKIALEKIEAGDNDPRAVAKEVLDDFRSNLK